MTAPRVLTDAPQGAGPSARVIFRVVAIVVLVVIALYLIVLLRRPLTWIFIAGFLAIALSGPVNVTLKALSTVAMTAGVPVPATTVNGSATVNSRASKATVLPAATVVPLPAPVAPRAELFRRVRRPAVTVVTPV